MSSETGSLPSDGPDRPASSTRSRELPSDELSRLSDRLGLVLELGVAVSALLLLAGLLLALATATTAQLFPALSSLTHPSWRALEAGGAPLDLMMAGLATLVATPIARVVLCWRTFAAGGENDYVSLIGLVLLTLLASFLIGWWL